MYSILKSILFIFLFCISINSLAKNSIIAPKAIESLLLDIEKLPSGRLVTVGERGHILLSDDAGESWRQVAVPSQDNLTAVDFLDDKHGVAVGFEQTILVTEDGGESWQLKHYMENAIDSPALFDVIFINNKKLIAIGAYGLYLESMDAGLSWTNREVSALSDIYESFSHLYSVTRMSASNHLVLAGEKYVSAEDDNGEETSTGLLAESRDAGRTWKKLKSPYDGSFFGINVDSKNNIYAYGLRGNVFISKNNGASWSSLNLQVASGIHDLIFKSNNDWIAVGTGGVLLEKNSTKHNLYKRSDLKGRAAIVSLDDNQYVVVGEGGIERFSLKQGDKEQE